MIQLQDTEFAPCSVSWDKDKKEFRKNTRDEIYLCCDAKCDKYRGGCDQLCNEKHDEAVKGTLGDCLFSCHVMGNVCDKMCQSARFDWNQKYFDDCLKKTGCLKNEFLDNKCLIDNKDGIMGCCLRNCRPEKNLNCEQHCATSYDINLERSAPVNITKSHQLNPTYNGDKHSNLWVYLLVLSLFLVVCIFIVFKLKWLNTKS